MAVLERCRDQGVTLAEISLRSDDDIEFGVEGGSVRRYGLRSQAALDSLVGSLSSPLYLDITGLPVSAWAPLVPRILESGVLFRVIYTEPGHYARSEVPTPGKLFDLSEHIGGVSPIPSFASIQRLDRGGVILIPILGFEGARLEFILSHEELPSDRIFPILGAPGFRLEYPHYALLGNKMALLQEDLSQHLTLVKASSPFDLFDALRRIELHNQGARLRIAPLGTKPHALGAVLFASARRPNVELLYDNAIPRPGASSGSSKVWTYLISEFVQSPLFAQVSST